MPLGDQATSMPTEVLEAARRPSYQIVYGAEPYVMAVVSSKDDVININKLIRLQCVMKMSGRTVELGCKPACSTVVLNIKKMFEPAIELSQLFSV